ncbi:hypothetical protein [Ekhidna sp.]|uniref:hypothetical protein n=1 Tax=Ekhidna sp. TaxID=2608089 RepID=UPI003519372E
MRSSFLLILLIIFTNCSSTREEQSNPIIDEFFNSFNHQNSDKAIDYLFSTNEWIKKDDPHVLKLKEDIAKTINALGDYYGYEQVSTETMGNNLTQYEFLLKFDVQPLRFTITLYKPFTEWQVQNFHYDYNFIEELKK